MCLSERAMVDTWWERNLVGTSTSWKDPGLHSFRCLLRICVSRFPSSSLLEHGIKTTLANASQCLISCLFSGLWLVSGHAFKLHNYK